MDQKNEVESVVYHNRITRTVSDWNNKNVESGKIIGKDGTVFAKGPDGRLVQIAETPEIKRAMKFVSSKVVEQGLISSASEKSAVAEISIPVSAEFVNEV